MQTYQVRVKIDIVPSTDSPTPEPVKQADGSVHLTLTESEAIDIDACERAVLQTVYPTLRETLSTHFSAVSKRNAQAHMRAGATLISPWKTYQVDGEVGRFEFPTHQITHEGTILYDTAHEIFPRRRCWEWYKTSGFKEVAFIYGATEESYRKTSRLINRVRYQSQDGTPSRTVGEQAEREGGRLIQAIDRKTRQILQAHDFREDGHFEGKPETYQALHPVTIPDERVADAIATCQARVNVDADLTENPVLYEAPEWTVNLSIDDVGVKGQKAERACRNPVAEASAIEEPRKEPPKRKRKYVHNTVVHIEKASRSYLVTGHGLKHVLTVLIAFLLNSDLLHTRLQFFTDGYTLLHKAIQVCFSWYANLGIILDWYHLEEKCKLQLSLAMTGTEWRNEALEELLPLLWYGLIDHAIAFIQTLAPAHIKSPDALTTLIRYFERNRAHIPCYAVRKELGLRNSSQIGEKMNDLVVSERQKHNGMSWSVPGSVALASLTALARNNEYAQWFHEGDIAFRLAA